jgi:hypothetical protein
MMIILIPVIKLGSQPNPIQTNETMEEFSGHLGCILVIKKRNKYLKSLFFFLWNSAHDAILGANVSIKEPKGECAKPPEAERIKKMEQTLDPSDATGY